MKLSLAAVAMVDLMLERGAEFKFQSWADLKTNDPVVADFISVGACKWSLSIWPSCWMEPTLLWQQCERCDDPRMV